MITGVISEPGGGGGINRTQSWDSLFSNHWTSWNYFYAVSVTPRHYYFIYDTCTASIFSVTRNNCKFGLADGKSVKGEEMSEVHATRTHATPELRGGKIRQDCEGSLQSPRGHIRTINAV